VNATESSNGTSLAFAVAKGVRYDYVVEALAGYTLGGGGTGSVVANAHHVVHLGFHPTTYAVTFTEHGLPNGDLWKVVIKGRAYSTKGSSIVVALPDGTFGYAIHGPRGYAPTPPFGTVTVSGGPASVTITFAVG